MDLRDVELPASLLQHYASRGIETLYPPQAAAVDAGLLDGESIVAAVPTASGKTLIAELAMATSPGTALYVVPLRALAAEKHREFSELPGVDVAIATGDYEATPDGLSGNDIVVATSEKVDSLVRHDADWLDDLSCVALDEVHLLDDRDRGPTLEVTVAKLRDLAPDVQVVALSATIPNARAVADWLDATLVASEWRPIDLRRGFCDGSRLVFEDGPGRDLEVADSDDTACALVRETLTADEAQCLVFVHSRRAAEQLARTLSAEWFGAASDTADAIAETARTETGETLATSVRSGVAFHHAGLRTAHRTLVEDAFRDRQVDVVCATPTLAAGVNLPARRVVVRDDYRYTDEGRTPLPVLEVHQMFGRAGRPGLDPHGEALLVAEDGEEAAALRERYLEGDPAPIESKLARQDALRTHVLATIASGFADSREGLLDVLEGTFYAAHADHADLVDVTDLLLDYLASVEMLETGDRLTATDLGEEVSRRYIDPRTAADMVGTFEAARSLERVTPLTVLEIVCTTSEMPTSYLRSGDRAAALRFAERTEDVFVTSMDDVDGSFEGWLASLETVRVIRDWMDGMGEDDLTATHGIGPGDLRTRIERAVWLLSAAIALGEVVGAEERVLEASETTLAAIEAREA